MHDTRTIPELPPMMIAFIITLPYEVLNPRNGHNVCVIRGTIKSIYSMIYPTGQLERTQRKGELF